MNSNEKSHSKNPWVFKFNVLRAPKEFRISIPLREVGSFQLFLEVDKHSEQSTDTILDATFEVTYLGQGPDEPSLNVLSQYDQEQRISSFTPWWDGAMLILPSSAALTGRWTIQGYSPQIARYLAQSGYGQFMP